MAAKVGLDLITYLADSVGTPVYTNPVAVVKDESIGLTTALADITDRRADGWRLQKPTLTEGTVTVTLMYEPADADFIEFQTAFFDKTQIVLFFADGDATAAGTWKGLLAAFYVSSFNQTRALEDAVLIEAELVPTLEATSDEPPVWHSVTVSP